MSGQNQTVRAKFQVTERIETASGHRVKMMPVTGGSKENENFFKWTPTGSLEMGTVNADAAEKFKPGTEFYIDFTPVTKEENVGG